VVRLPSYLAAALLLLSSWPAVAGQAPDRPTFRAGVDLVPVAAVVRDPAGRVVAGLRADDFVVVDGGVRRSILSFSEDASAAVSLAVLVDESGSMRAHAGAVRLMVATMLDEVDASAAPADAVALVGFDSDLREIQPFTTDLARVRGALDRVDAFGATAVHDAIAETARRLVPRRGRRAVVVVSDGVDTRSRFTLAEASGIASAIDVPVYIVLVGDRGARRLREASGPLEDLARWAGGEAFDAAAPDAARTAARRIVSDVRHQYLIAFESAPEPGWRLLEIHTRQPGLVVRARSAYVAGRDGLRTAR